MKLVLVLVPILILFGAINTIQLKLQNIQVISQNPKATFFHPFLQTVCMFIGETLIGFLYLFQYIKQKNESKQITFPIKKPAPQWQVLFPAVMDLLSTLLSYIALNMVDSSVWQISRGGNIITTALLSRFFLKRTFSPTSILGCFLAFLGITSVQVVAVVTHSNTSSQDLTIQIIGIVLLVASIIFNSCGLVYQKYIFNKYQMSPLKMVFLEGVYGLLFMVPLTIGFQYISCPWDDKSQCVSANNGYFLQNINNFWNEINSNLFLFLLNIGLIISIGISVPIAVTVSKQISPVSRSLADVCRTIFIWIFGIVITLTYGVDHKEYQIENTTVLVNSLKGVGFIVLITGTLLYHQLIPLPFCLKKKQNEHIESLLEAETQSEGSFVKTDQK